MFLFYFFVKANLWKKLTWIAYGENSPATRAAQRAWVKSPEDCNATRLSPEPSTFTRLLFVSFLWASGLCKVSRKTTNHQKPTKQLTEKRKMENARICFSNLLTLSRHLFLLLLPSSPRLFTVSRLSQMLVLSSLNFMCRVNLLEHNFVHEAEFILKHLELTQLGKAENFSGPSFCGLH